MRSGEQEKRERKECKFLLSCGGEAGARKSMIE